MKTLVDYLEKDLSTGRIILPKYPQEDKEMRERFYSWVANTIDKMIRKEGAFFKGYESRVMDRYLLEKTGREFFRKLIDTHPGIRSRMKKYKDISLSLLVEKTFEKYKTAVLPKRIRRNILWFYEDKKAKEFLKRITRVTFLPTGIFLVKLAEPYNSFFDNTKTH